MWICLNSTRLIFCGRSDDCLVCTVPLVWTVPLITMLSVQKNRSMHPCMDPTACVSATPGKKLKFVVDVREGMGCRYWWVLVGTGRYWWAVGTGGCIPGREQDCTFI
eukprot:1082285-Pelagomonas_calceolata.AAC.4